MHFLAICRPKFQTFSLPCLPWGHPTEPPSWANIKETEFLRKNSYRQKCLDKSLNVQFLRYRVRQTELFVILGHFFHFYLSQLMMLKIKILKKKKNETNAWRYYHFTQVYHKRQSYDVWFLRYRVRRTERFVILDHFLPFCPLTPEKSKFWKNEKNTWRHYHFTEVYHKWRSYDVWFLRYWARWTEFFAILDYFLLFYPPNNPNN